MPPLASSNRPIFWAMAPVKAPLLVSEELALEQACRNGGAVQLHERPRAAAAQIVDGSGDELLARAGFPLDEHGRVGGRDDLHLGEDVLQWTAGADDLLEVVLAANFVLEIQLLLVELFLELGDLTVGETILDGNRDLLCNLVEQLDLVPAERVLPEPSDIERAHDAIVRLKWNAAERLHTLCEKVLRDLGLGRQGNQVCFVEHGRGARRERNAARRLHARVSPAFFHEAFVLRHFQHVAPVLARVRLVQHEAAAVVLNHFLQRRADRREHVVHVQVRDDGIVHFKEQPESIALARELVLHRTGALFMQDVIDRDRDLLGHFLHERDFAGVVFVLLQRPESHRAQTAERRRQGYGAERLHAVLAQAWDDGSEPVLECDVVDDQRLLCLPDKAAGGLVDGELGALAVSSIRPAPQAGAAASHCVSASCSTTLM